jgi:hypothetical protein
MKLYPDLHSDGPKFSGEKQIKMDEEQIAVFNRLNKLNVTYRSPNNLTYALVGTQIKLAEEDKKKQAEALEKGKSAAGKGSEDSEKE